MKKKLRLGVNIDHVATLRNARNEDFPNLLKVASILKNCNVDLITVHLREDRRHIRDKDVEQLKNKNYLPLNLEMAATDEMKNICFKTNPFSCCIVPERREELTTEGGLDVKNQLDYLGEFLSDFKNKDIKFYTYSNCPISSRIKNNVFWEKHLHDIFEKFINEKSIVIEGGCHIGAHTLKMALICKHIYAFEPFPTSFDLLNNNVKVNNLENVSIIKKGLSKSDWK